MKKLVCLLLFPMMLLSSCGKLLDVEKGDEVINKDNALLSQVELINNENRYLIGTEVNDDSSPEIIRNPSKVFDGESNTEPHIPENAIVKKLADDTILPPISITNIEVIKGTSPEIIMPNGSAVLFTQEDLSGWTCKVGDKLIYEFEKYKSDVSSEQTMIIGYILNGVLYSGEEFKKLNGTYQLEIVENGDYYIYIISATSDYLALKEGTISIVSNK